jgi:penicillin-binding protein 2
VHIPINPQDWITITDAMAGVVNPGGTAAASHIQGVDFGGKTGSAQVVSNQFRKSKSGSGSQFKDNSWFVGVSPRRNPEIVVSVLFEGGEHGRLAAHMAADVVKAYVDKQRRIRKNPTLFSDKVDPGSVPMAGIWNAPDLGEELDHDSAESSGHLQAGTILVKIGRGKVARNKTVRTFALGASGAD